MIRKQRTRTLIQGGGLLEKAGTLDLFGITPGDDLQKDPELQEKVTELFGGLLELKAIVENKDYFPELWQSKGKKGLAGE